MQYSQSTLRELAIRWTGSSRIPKKFRIIRETTDFFRVDYNDIVMLNDHAYLIRNNEKEGRFGIDEEPKFWVKRAIDLNDGSQKIIKLVFKERFKAKVGPLVFDCIRSPAKEARIIDLVSGHDHFMHGVSALDESGNIIRILDYIHGIKLHNYIENIQGNHFEYFHMDFPAILSLYIETVSAIKFLHDNNEKHGDIRRDHLILDNETKKLKWIDFDFNYTHHENKHGYDLFGLGNILIYIVGKGDVTLQSLMKDNLTEYRRINGNDVNIIFHNRVVNLQKIYPYIPDSLNTVLLHFSTGTEIFYDNVSDFLEDVEEAEMSFDKN